MIKQNPSNQINCLCLAISSTQISDSTRPLPPTHWVKRWYTVTVHQEHIELAHRRPLLGVLEASEWVQHESYHSQPILES